MAQRKTTETAYSYAITEGSIAELLVLLKFKIISILQSVRASVSPPRMRATHIHSNFAFNITPRTLFQLLSSRESWDQRDQLDVEKVTWAFSKASPW